MKIRNGFVTNSSSSSFIVAAKPGQTKVKISLEIDLNDFADEKYNKMSEIDNDTFSILAERIEEDETDRKYIQKLLDDGYTIYEGSFSDEGEPLESFLCTKGLKCTDFNGIILENEGGY